jgi:hypothetical protein
LGVKVLEPKSCLLLAMPSLAFTESGSWPSSPETGDGNQKSSSKLHCSHPIKKMKNQIKSNPKIERFKNGM